MILQWLRGRRAFQVAVTEEVERILLEGGRLHAHRIASTMMREEGQDAERQRFTCAVQRAVADRLGVRRGYDSATRRLYGD